MVRKHEPLQKLKHLFQNLSPIIILKMVINNNETKFPLELKKTTDLITTIFQFK